MAGPQGMHARPASPSLYAVTSSAVAPSRSLPAASGDLLAKVGQLWNEERPPLKERRTPGTPLPAPPDPLAVAPRRLDQACPGDQGPHRLGRRPRMRGIARTAAEDDRRNRDRGDVPVGD